VAQDIHLQQHPSEDTRKPGAVEGEALGDITPNMSLWTLSPPADLPALPQCLDWGKWKANQWFFPSRRTAGLPRYIGPGHGWSPTTLKTYLRGRRVVLLGDSVTRQWYDALVCYLGAEFPGWDAGVAAARRRTGELTRLAGKDIRFSHQEFNSVVLPEIGAQIAAYVFHAPGLTPQKRAIISYHARVEHADLIIINEGLHYNDKTGALGKSLENIIRHCQQEHANCVLRETTPQHFSGQSGLYKDRGKQKHCWPPTFQEAATAKFLPKANWRNGVLRKVASRYPHIPVMAVFDDMLPLGFAHPGTDCTHFLGDMEVWEPSHFKLVALLKRLP